MRQEVKVELTMDCDIEVSKAQILEFIEGMYEICPNIMKKKFKNPTIEHFSIKEECEIYGNPSPKIKDLWMGDFPNEENWIRQNVNPSYIDNVEGLNEHIYSVSIEDNLIKETDVPDYINPFIVVEVGDASYFRFIE